MTVAKNKLVGIKRKVNNKQTDNYNEGVHFYIYSKQGLYSKSGQKVTSVKVQQRNVVMELNKYSLLATNFIQNNVWKQ